MAKFNFEESPVRKVAEEIRDNHESLEQGRVEQVTKTSPVPDASAVAYETEPTKGISVKIPFSLYDELDAIKKRTQRTGNRRDKMGIGDLVVLAVKEFVERNKVG